MTDSYDLTEIPKNNIGRCEWDRLYCPCADTNKQPKLSYLEHVDSHDIGADYYCNYCGKYYSIAFTLSKMTREPQYDRLSLAERNAIQKKYERTRAQEKILKAEQMLSEARKVLGK